MTSMVDISDSVALLRKLLPRPTGDHYPSKLREALFQGAAISLGLMVKPSADAGFVPLAAGTLGVAEETFREALQLSFAKYLTLLGGERAPASYPSVVGVHFVDPELGRYSRISIPPTRPCPASALRNPQAQTAEQGKRVWWYAYPQLWLRVYKQLLHPSTSLINAYERHLLRWPETGILVHWADQRFTKEKATKKPKANATLFKRVMLRRSYNVHFIEDTRSQLSVLHSILVGRSESSTPPADSPAFQRLVDEVALDVERRCLVTTLKDIREAYLRLLLSAGAARDEFLAILKDMGGADGEILARLRDQTGNWHDEIRRKAMEGIEVLQTILFNEPGFCDERGLLVERKELDDCRVYLLLGFDNAFGLDLERYQNMTTAFHLTLAGIKTLLPEAKKPSVERENPPDPGIVKILSYLNHVRHQGADGGAYRFLRFAQQLSREAVHEGRELCFLLGFGHAEAPEIRCRKPIRLPGHLSGEGVGVDLLVHFVKSYFSLFSREDRVLWFDESARCHGLYGRAPQDGRDDWLRKWDSKSYFVRVTGKGRFDVLEADESEGDHRPRVRVVGENVVDLQSTAAIQDTITLAAGVVFESQSERAGFIAKLVGTVADRLREEGRGAGLVVANMLAKAAGSWRIDINQQVKPLVPDLAHFGEAIARFDDKDAMNRLEDLAEDVCRLAELDGAVYLKCTDNEIYAYPARHFFPLVKADDMDARKAENASEAQQPLLDAAKPEDKPRSAVELLNFYKWSDDGAAALKTRKDGGKQAVDTLAELLGKGPARGYAGLRKLSVDKMMNVAKSLTYFSKLDDLKLYAAFIRGLSHQFKDLSPEHVIRTVCKDLSFLTSAGTRHHSLWGITVSAEQRLFVVSISQDGRVSVFWDGRLIPSPMPEEKKDQ